MSKKVVALRTKNITPRIVLESLQGELENTRDLYVVLIDKNGDPAFYATGDLSTLCYAATVMQDYATRFVRGEIVEER